MKDVADDVVKFADRPFAALSSKLNSFGRNCVFKLMFKRLDVGAEEDLMSYKVNNVPHIEHVSLASIEGKLIRYEIEAGSVLRSIIGDGIAKRSV
jgi:hypothetical protein